MLQQIQHIYEATHTHTYSIEQKEQAASFLSPLPE